MRERTLTQTHADLRASLQIHGQYVDCGRFGVDPYLPAAPFRAVIVPCSTVITRASLERLRKFAAAGGKVIFAGRTPTMVVDKDFPHAGDAPDLSFAVVEASGDITAAVIRALPKPDVALDRPCAPIKYTHRNWRDADLYFFFNESSERQAHIAQLAGRGQAQVWDAGTGLIHPTRTVATATEGVRLPLSWNRTKRAGPLLRKSFPWTVRRDIPGSCNTR